MEGDRSKQLGLAVEVFTSMVAQPNRIGLVTFAGGAALRQPLTNDRDAVGRALRGTILSAGTRIDIGLQKAREELNGANHRQEFAKVIVLITDGEHNGTPEDTVLEQAALAKKEGAIIFTIALGTTQRGQDLLKLVATSPDRHFFFSPSPTQLVAIYQEIARAIPCPTSTPTP
jgi:Mg-chelatase subunit ChlD